MNLMCSAAKFKATCTVVLIFVIISSCDNDYVPISDRMTFQQCRQTREELQAMVVNIFSESFREFDSVKKSSVEWMRPGRREQYQKIEKELNICSIKQAFERDENESGSDYYNRLYVSLVALNLNIQLFLEDVESERSKEWLGWRAKTIEESIIRLRKFNGNDQR